MMKLKPIICILFVVSFPTLGQTKEEGEVTDAVERLRVAMVDPAKETLMALTSADLSYGHSGGKVEDQAAFIEALVSGRSNFSRIELNNESVRVTGNIAIVRHRLSGDVVDNGQASTVNLNIMMVWRKEKGKWKLLARQSSRA